MQFRWLIALLALVGTCTVSATSAVHPAANRPNIVFILADDLGCVDVNCFAERVTGVPAARQFYETPNLDRLAREGTAFSQAYACPLCSPTRAGLLTGRNAARIGVTTATPASVKTFYNQGFTPPPGYLANDAIYWGDNIKIPQALLNGSTLDALPSGQPLDQGRDELTLAEALKDYRSAFLGKWHLGSHGARGWQPRDQGFEELAYTDEGSSPYFHWRGAWDNRQKRFPQMPQPELLAGKAGPDTGREYLTDSLTQVAVQFLHQQAAQPGRQPFFLYFCHLAVHGPEQAKPADIAHFEGKPTRGWNGHSNAVYAAMLKSLDESVGRVLDTLAQTGLETNTLVVFMSDNGGVTYNAPPATCNAPFKGGKAMLFEGGIRVPLIFRWPGQVPGGQWCEVPVDYADIFPTLLEFARYEVKPHYPRIDGRSLLPLLKDPANTTRGYERDTHYWHYPFNVAVVNPEDGLPPAPHSAIREGDDKLIFDWSGKLYLYGLKTDWREAHNLADARPARAKDLFTKLNRWLDQNVAVKYTPLLNPNYDPAQEARSRPFVDLRKQLLGEKYAIRSAASDPRIGMLSTFPRGAALRVDHLRCEYGENPLGLDVLTPRLSWQLVSDERGQRQTAYRILVASSPKVLERGEGDLWDSGKVASDQNLHVRYAGKPLVARQQCFWQVQAWDNEGRVTEWSPVATWEIGLPAPMDWQEAQWIRLGRAPRHSPLTHRPVQTKNMAEPRLVEAFPSPLFRREFVLKAGVTRARAYVCGLGYNEVYVNGQRSGDAVLDPGQTTYDARAFYVTHDITRWLKLGTNVIGVMLGNGFFGQNHAFSVAALANGQPALLASIVVDYADGSTQRFRTDETWKAETGPILYDNVYGGETYDARLEKPGWNKPGYDDSQWAAAVRVPAPTARLQAQMLPPIRCIRTIPPRSVFAGREGKWIFDLGQNIAGWARLKVQAPSGTQLTLKFAEILMPDGKELDTATTGVFATGVEQTDVYVCKGGGSETWSPRFTYHGFRYVEVAGLPARPGKDFLEGVLVRSDVPARGSFSCSDELLNRIYRTSLWTIEDNLHSTSEDCPHREKCGWLGDAHAVGETTIYNFDMAQFWTKFVDDIETTLGRGGVTYWGEKATPGIPCNIAVGRRLCQEARPDWGAAYVLLPWYLYRYYGDREVFSRHYEHLKQWVEYVRNLREDGIVVRGYGDWCPPGGNANMECPPPLTSTAFFYGTLQVMEEFARQRGKNEDAAVYARLADETKAAFNRKFFDKQKKGYGSQTANAVALRFGLEPAGQGRVVAQALANEVAEQHQGHAFVGIHGGRPLYTQLCEHGYEATAIAAMKQQTWPSFTCTLAQGFTTWPEQADELKPGERMAGRSLNHPMQSGFAAWFHESVGGIQPAAPGFKRILLKPCGYTQLAWAKAEHDSLYGPIISHWRCQNGTFAWHVSIPPNTTATIFVPVKSGGVVTESGKPIEACRGVKFLRTENSRAIYEVESGWYDFQSAIH